MLARSLGGRRHVCCRVVSGRSRRGRLHVVCRCCSATSSSLRRRGAVGARDGHDTHRVGNTSTYVVSWDSEARGDGPISEGCVVGMAVVFVSQLPLDIDPIQSFFPCLHSILLLQLAWAAGQLETDRLAEDEWCLAGRSVLAGRFLFVLAGSPPPSYANSSRCFRSQFSARSLGRSGRYPLRTDRSLPLSWGWLPGSLVGLQFRELPGPWGPKGVELLVFSFVVVVRPLVGNTTRLVYPGWLKFPDRSTWYVCPGRRGARGMGWVAPPGHRPLNGLWKFSSHAGSILALLLVLGSRLILSCISRGVLYPSRGSQVARHAGSVALERAASLPIRRPIYTVLT